MIFLLNSAFKDSTRRPMQDATQARPYTYPYLYLYMYVCMYIYIYIYIYQIGNTRRPLQDATQARPTCILINTDGS